MPVVGVILAKRSAWEIALNRTRELALTLRDQMARGEFPRWEEPPARKTADPCWRLAMSVASLGPARTISCRQAPLSSLSSALRQTRRPMRARRGWHGRRGKR